MPVPKRKENLNQYGRAADAPCERDRGANGFTKLNHKDFWPDIPRLTNGGKVQILLILWIFRMRGAPGPRGVKTPAGWTPWIRWDELAERFGCSVRSVQDDTHDLDIPNAQNKRAGRGVIETEEGTGPRRASYLVCESRTVFYTTFHVPLKEEFSGPSRKSSTTWKSFPIAAASA